MKKHISLSLAKAIHEAAEEKGLKLPSSQHQWYNERAGTDKEVWKLGTGKYFDDGIYRTFRAFDCPELGLILPTGFSLRRTQKGYSCSLPPTHRPHTEKEKDAAEAMGKLFLYWIQNGLITQSDLDNLHSE